MGVWKPKQSRFWHYEFRFKGCRFHGSTGVETRRKAEAVERRRREEAALGLPQDGGLTLDQAAGRWWSEVGQHRKSAHIVERRIATVLRLVGAGRRISDIATRDVARAIEQRRGETYSRAPDRPATARRPARKAKRYAVANATVNLDIIGTLRPILTRARKTWQEPGLQEIDWRALTLAEPPPRIQYYTDAQQAAWLNECDDSARVPLRLLLTYGLRYGELFFPPAAFDPEGPRLVLARRKKDPHVVPLRADDARQIAARVGRAAAANLTCIWYEADPKGKLVELTYLGLQARLRSAAKRAKIPPGRVIHGARHHAGTAILRQTRNLKVAQQLLGHVDIKSTLRYAHALEDELRAGLEAESRNSPEAPTTEAEFSPPKQRRNTPRPRLS